MKCNSIYIIAIPEGEESEQRIENMFEEIMMENFLNLVKEKVTQVPRKHRIPITMNLERPTLRSIIIKMAKFKDRERTLKAARETQLPTREFLSDCQLISQQKHCRPEGQSNEKQRPATKTILSNKAIV